MSKWCVRTFVPKSNEPPTFYHNSTDWPLKAAFDKVTKSYWRERHEATGLVSYNATE